MLRGCQRLHPGQHDAPGPCSQRLQLLTRSLGEQLGTARKSKIECAVQRRARITPAVRAPQRSAELVAGPTEFQPRWRALKCVHRRLEALQAGRTAFKQPQCPKRHPTRSIYIAPFGQAQLVPQRQAFVMTAVRASAARARSATANAGDGYRLRRRSRPLRSVALLAELAL